MILSEWDAPEGHPGQCCVHLYARILSTSFTSVSIFSVCLYSIVFISVVLVFDSSVSNTALCYSIFRTKEHIFEVEENRSRPL